MTEENWRSQLAEVKAMAGVLMGNWPCVCGRRHKPHWRTTPPPSCTVIRGQKVTEK